MTVTITPHGTSEILEQQFDDLRKFSRTAMRDATHLAAEELRHLAPGSISEHIDERLSSSPGTVTGSTFPTDYFAKYVDEGTGEYVAFHHPIAPKAGRRASNPRAALKLGDGVYRRRVRGQPGQHFVERAREQAESRVEQLLMRPAEQLVQRIAR